MKRGNAPLWHLEAACLPDLIGQEVSSMHPHGTALRPEVSVSISTNASIGICAPLIYTFPSGDQELF